MLAHLSLAELLRTRVHFCTMYSVGCTYSTLYWVWDGIWGYEECSVDRDSGVEKHRHQRSTSFNMAAALDIQLQSTIKDIPEFHPLPAESAVIPPAFSIPLHFHTWLILFLFASQFRLSVLFFTFPFVSVLFFSPFLFFFSSSSLFWWPLFETPRH